MFTQQATETQSLRSPVALVELVELVDPVRSALPIAVVFQQANDLFELISDEGLFALLSARGLDTDCPVVLRLALEAARSSYRSWRATSECCPGPTTGERSARQDALARATHIKDAAQSHLRDVMFAIGSHAAQLTSSTDSLRLRFETAGGISAPVALQ